MFTNLVNIVILIGVGVLSILNQITAVEYLINQEKYSNFLYYSLWMSIFIFYSVSFLYILMIVLTFATFNDSEIESLDQSEYEYNIVRYLYEHFGCPSLILVLPVYYLLSITKFMGILHIANLIEGDNKIYFTTVKSHIMFTSTIIQIASLTIPQIFLQSINNLLLNEDIHDVHARGLINLSNLSGVIYLSLQGTIAIIASSETFARWNNKSSQKPTSAIIEGKEML